MQDQHWPGDAGSPQQDSEGHLDINRALLGRKWLVVFLVLVGAGLGYLQFAKTPPVYTSSARVAVEWNRPPIRTDHDGGQSQADPIVGHIARIRSPIVLELAIKDEAARITSLASIGTSNPMASLQAGLQVVQDENSKDILHFSFTCGSREDSQRVLSTVIRAYERYLESQQSNAAKEAVHIIAQLKTDVSEAIDVQEQEYQAFRNQAKLFWSGSDGLNIHTQRMGQIESVRAGLLLDRVQKQSRVESIRDLVRRGENREALLVALDQLDRAYGQLGPGGQRPAGFAGELVQAEIEREMLLTQGLAAGHPKLKQIERRMELLRGYMQRERDELEQQAAQAEPVEVRSDVLDVYQQSLVHEIEILDNKLRGLNESFLTEETEAKALSNDENRNRMLTEGLARKKALYDSLLAKLESVEIVGGLGGFRAKRMEEPGLGRQVAPVLMRYVAVGGVVGLLLAMGISVALEMTDRSFRDPQQIAKMFGVPVIGHVPMLDTTKDRRLVSDSNVDPTVVTYHRPSSRQAECYRNVRAALMIGARGANRVVQVTSSNPGDGKTTLASNLAVAIAKSGKRCLLIDCDFRRPRVHKVFGLPNTVGVSTVITDGTDLPDVTYTGGIGDLDIIPAGPRTESPGELLLSPRFSEMIQVARERYDFVVVDTPPVLAVSDASAVAAMVDGVVLVTRISRDNRPIATRCRQTLELVGGRIVGVVVNAVDELSAYGNYAGYGSSYSRYNYTRTYGKYYREEHKGLTEHPAELR